MVDVRDHGALAVGGQHFKHKQVAPAESASDAVMMPAIARWMFIATEAGRLPSTGPPKGKLWEPSDGPYRPVHYEPMDGALRHRGLSAALRVKNSTIF